MVFLERSPNSALRKVLGFSFRGISWEEDPGKFSWVVSSQEYPVFGRGFKSRIKPVRGRPRDILIQFRDTREASERQPFLHPPLHHIPSARASRPFAPAARGALWAPALQFEPRRALYFEQTAIFRQSLGRPLTGLIRLLRLLPSRVGFAERDASRPAFGGRSLVSLTKHTCVGRGPIGPRLSVRPSRPKKSATTPALWVRDLTVKERLSGASWRGEATAWRSHGLSAAKDGD